MPTLEELRAKMNLDELKKKYDRKEPVIFNDNLKNRQEMERHKRELIDGKKNLLKGIYGNINTSVYTESYKTHPKKYANTTLPDFRTSGIKGRMPEEYILKRQIGSLRIGEDLQSKVREIAFK